MPLTAVVPKPSEQRSSATMRSKAKEVLISQTRNNAYKGKKGSTDLSDLSLNRWLDDAAIQQGANRVSCQVTVVVVVTGIDISSTDTLTRPRRSLAPFSVELRLSPFLSLQLVAIATTPEV